MQLPLDAGISSRHDRRLRLQEPDTRVRISAGKRGRKWRDKRNRQTKPGMTRH